jgi:hypothetical protein
MAEAAHERFERLLREGEQRYVGPDVDATPGVHHLEWLGEAMRLIEVTAPGALAAKAAEIFNWPSRPAEGSGLPYSAPQHLAMLSILRAAHKSLDMAPPAAGQGDTGPPAAPLPPPEYYNTRVDIRGPRSLEATTRHLKSDEAFTRILADDEPEPPE